MPHVTPSHAELACARLGQGVHDAPQVVTESFAVHAPEHRWKPVLQVEPHCVPSHVAVALPGTGHGVQELPHDAGESVARH